jgi:2-dehydro-3-deoxyphosphogluconate aldolase/(4S)-4-hydroxy-2-oxoglutarate aldolase
MSSRTGKSGAIRTRSYKLISDSGMGKLDTYSRVKEVGVIPAIRTCDPDKAAHAAKAISLGGIPIIEVSLAPARGFDVLKAIVKAHDGSILVGVGSVVDSEEVIQAAQAGAQFIVTPGFSSAAVEKAKELGLAIFAGALTPTEVQIAFASGADAVKLFPCFVTGGTRYLKALRGQYPRTDFIVSGGVGLDNCADYIRAGACAIGVGAEIADVDSVASGEYRVLTVRAKRLSEAVRDARVLLGKHPPAERRLARGERSA